MAHYRSRPFQATNEYGDARLGSDWQAKRRMARREGAAGHFVSSRLRTRSRTARVGPNEDNSCLHPVALSVGLTKVPNMVWGHAHRGLIQMCSALAKYKCMPTDNPKVPTLVILGTFVTGLKPEVNADVLRSPQYPARPFCADGWCIDDEAAVDARRTGRTLDSSA